MFTSYVNQKMMMAKEVSSEDKDGDRSQPKNPLKLSDHIGVTNLQQCIDLYFDKLQFN